MFTVKAVCFAELNYITLNHMAKSVRKTKTKRAGKVTVEPVTQISVTLKNAPGELARLAEALSERKVSLDGLCRTDTSGAKVTEQLIVDDVKVAKKVLASQGKKFSTTKILKFSCADDQPGVVAVIARKFSDAGINIENVFHSSAGRGSLTVLYVAVKPTAFAKALRISRKIR